jgi:hypothetical protein
MAALTIHCIFQAHLALFFCGMTFLVAPNKLEKYQHYLASRRPSGRHKKLKTVSSWYLGRQHFGGQRCNQSKGARPHNST